MSLNTIGSRRRERLKAAANADAAYFQQVSRDARAMTTEELGEERAPQRADFSAGAPTIVLDSVLSSPDLRGQRDAEAVDEEASTAEPVRRQLPAVRAWLTGQFRSVPRDEDEAFAAAETTRLDAVPSALAAAPPFRDWSERDVQEHADELRELYLDQAATPTAEEGQGVGAEQLPERRRRHLPAVAWVAEHFRVVPVPAPSPAPTPFGDEQPDRPGALPAETARLALETAGAAALGEAGEMRPADFVQWLRLELADVAEACDAAIAEHARTAQADLDALAAGYFQDIDAELDDLNAATLPGWTLRLAAAGTEASAR